MEVKKENVLAAYETAREAGAGVICRVLEALFGEETFKQPKDVTERIKTFEDACRELGENHQYMRAYREWKRIEYAGCKDIEAYLKLRIICAALNEGWEPQFTDDEYRHFPYFFIYTKKELEEMDEEERSRVIGRAHYNANGGPVCAYEFRRIVGLEHVLRVAACLQIRGACRLLRKTIHRHLG